MAAHTRRFNHPDRVRARIRTALIAKRLENHSFGIVEMTVTQIRAAEILLRKTVPDLLGIAHSGTVEVRPEEMTDAALVNIATASSSGAIEAPAGQAEPSELH